MRRATGATTGVGAAVAVAALGLGACESGTDPRAAPSRSEQQTPTPTQVVLVSVDGLNPTAVRRLGREGAPTFHRLTRQGASTRNARTEHEQTDTLPNHTGMVTGRRIAAAGGGHGVTWNDDRTDPPDVQSAAGDDVESVFSRVDAEGGGSALFVSKAKLLLFERSWPDALDRSVLRTDNARLARTVAGDLRRRARAFRMVHLSLPDLAGHRYGFMSRPYLRAVHRADRLVGRILGAVRDSGRGGRTAVIVTADHGGRGADHRDPTRLVDHRVPFWVVGPGVEAGADLYELNPAYRDPGRRRTTYADRRQPVRNGAAANLALDLLGLGPVPRSEHDAEQDLRVTSR